MISDDSDNKPVDCGTNTPVSEGMKRVKKKKKTSIICKIAIKNS